MSSELQQLVEMSNELGRPDKPFAILGEGNTSARIDSDHFYVKASGTNLETITEEGFLPVSITKVTAILEDPGATDDDVARVLTEGIVGGGDGRKPSVETMLHALLYQYPEYNYIGHTHPEATSALMCSMNAKTLGTGRICPDHIVVMGPASVFVPYVDPGLVLAREVRARVRQFVDEQGEVPKAILMENHGLITLGATAKDVLNITEMAEKCARIIIDACSVGGVKFMSEQDIARIHTRPDEKYRQKLI